MPSGSHERNIFDICMYPENSSVLTRFDKLEDRLRWIHVYPSTLLS